MKKVLPFFAVGPMDHSGPIPMVNEFGLTPDSNFLNQPGGPPMNIASAGGPPSDLMGGQQQNGPRSGSPEFMTSGNFSEPPNMQNEGLVW